MIRVKSRYRVSMLRLAAVVATIAGIWSALGEAPTLSATRGNLEGLWRFAIDPQEIGETAGWQNPAFDDSGWRELRVPGLWEPQGVTDPRPGQAPRPKGDMPWSDYDGVAWYRRCVVIPAAWRGEPLVLLLGGVDDVDRTYVNGQLVGETGKGLPRPSTAARRYAVPPAVVRYGEANTLAVQVRDLGGPGGLVGPLLSLLPEKEMIVKALPAEDRPFDERFRDPAGSVRILKIVHGWPSGEGADVGLLENLRAQGFGGVVTNVAWGDDYLRNPLAWDQLRRVTARARGLGMALWLYDEKGYPSGTAGGQVLDGHPEWEAEGLLVASALTDGPLTLKLPPGTLMLAAAYPAGQAPEAAVPLSAQIADGELRWTPPPGRWQVLLITRDRIYAGTHAAMNLHRHQPYTNLLLPEPTARYLELTHAAYARELGADLGALFQATFTDEPSLMSAFLSPMPYAVLPWAANLPAEFARRRGYPLEPELAALAVADTPRARRVRYDFWQTVTELVRASFTLPIRDWCRAHKLPAGGHLLSEEGLRLHVPLYGSLFACLRDLDAPGIDCLTSLPPQVPWASARLAASVAELEGRTLTMSETSDHAQRYRPPGDQRPVRQVSLPEIRGTLNRLVVGGINTITSYYSFAGLTGSELIRLNEYVGRCCTAVRGGYQVADIAVVYPVESLWPHYDPAPHSASRNPAASRIEQAYLGALETLFAAGRDVTIIDAQALADARVDGGALVHGNLRWKVLVLPGVETLPAAAWDKVAAFHRAGGMVIGLALRPANSEREFPSAEVVAAGREWFGAAAGPTIQAAPGGGTGVFLPPGMESLLPGILDRLLEPDVRIPAGAPLRTTHRRLDGTDVYLVINDSPAPFRGRVVLAASGAGEAWDPESGTRTALPGPEVELDLDAYDAVVLRWPQARERQLLTAVGGGVKVEAEAALSVSTVELTPGEHVAAEPVATTTLPDGQPGWRVVGQVRTSDVDTFLFLRLRFSPAVEGSQADFIVVDMDVPTGQSVAAQAYLFAVEADGGEFLAPLGFALNEAGLQHAWVPWDRLKPVPWNKAGDGVLDRAKLVELRLGWGGYHGRVGERLEFSVAAPRLGRLAR
jgi:hypothetical protein